MKTKKSYRKGGKLTPKGRKANLVKPGAPKFGAPKPPPSKTREQLTMEKGGRMGLPKDISGMGRFGRKLKKLKPIGPKKIKNDAAMEAMVTSPKVQRSTATITAPAKKKRRLRRK
tara:strand:- start:436 stop:780 length:345 start_codon:yes stop_codon:yes gene_type:complete